MRLVDLRPEFYGAGGEGTYSPTGRPCPKCSPGPADGDCEICFGYGLEYEPAKERKGIGLSFNCPCQPCSNERAKIADPSDHYPFRVYVNFENPVDGGPKWEKGPWWTRTGETFEELRLSPSILSDPSKGGCGWHGYVGLNVPGEVTTC